MNRAIDDTFLEPFIGRTWALDTSTSEDLFVLKIVHIDQGEVVYLPTNFFGVPIHVKCTNVWNIIRIEDGAISFGRTINATSYTALGFGR